MRNVLKCLLFFFFLVDASGALARNMLKSDEFVMFFPGLVLEKADGSFSVDVDAWVFEKESRRIAIAALAAYAGFDFDKFSPEQKDLFAERSQFFRIDSKRGKQVKVRLGKRVFALPLTDRAGRAHADLSVGREEVGQDGVSWTLEAPGHPFHGLSGHARVIPAEGVSVVSDIDDTIKISNVLDKKALLRNTFLEPFLPVPGMADWYQEMSHGHNVVFHYLSASPMQLYPALSEFIKNEHFPAGILHLRESTSWRTLLAGKDTTIQHKKRVLNSLMAAFPLRRFILIGDSGENDPEIYADIALRYPSQVVAIHIRNVTNESRSAERYQKTFNGLDPQIWHIRD